MKLSKKIFTPVVICYSGFVIGAEIDHYTIRNGESLSKILMRLHPNERIYGNKGNLRRVLELNREIKNPDVVFPGQTIKLRNPNLNESKDTPRQGPVIHEERVDTQIQFFEKKIV